MKGVYSAVRTGSLNIAVCASSLKGNVRSCSSAPSGCRDGVESDSFIYTFMNFMVATLDQTVVFALLQCYVELIDSY